MAVRYGYTGKILRVNLSSGTISHIPTMDYADRFIGGRGIATKIYWDEVPPEVGALDPDNRLMFFTGPATGFKGIGANRWTVCGKSPLLDPEQFSYCSLAGDWGVRLKFAGYDGIVVQGESEKPVYLFIRDDFVEIRDASSIWGKSAIEAREILKGELGESAAVVDCGPGGENKVIFASLLADRDASGTSGFGAVLGAKKLKAIAVMGSGGVAAADPERLGEITKYVRLLLGDRVTSTSDYLGYGPKLKKDVCAGCIGACSRQIFVADDGTKGKYMCGAAALYMDRAMKYYGELNEVPFHATRLCNEYGLDALHVLVLIMWLSRCYQAGALTEENTGLPLSKMGSLEFIETMVKKLALREGFGDILAQGIHKAAELTGNGTEALITDYVSKAGHATAYCPRMYISSGILYAVEPRMPIQQVHQIGTALFAWRDWAKKVEGSYLSSDDFRKIAKRFWGSELAVDFSTYDGKALAAAMVQDREYAKESMILCDWMWPIVHLRNSEGHIGDPTIESKLLSAITGNETSEEELYRIGERLLNIQRAVLAREGHRGRDSDQLPEVYYTRPLKVATMNPECLAPGRDGEIMSRQGAVVDREAFEAMKDEYYGIRGWDVATGLQTKAKLEELDLRDIADELELRELIVVS